MSGPDDLHFGRLLRTHRVAAGLSQEELAERARLSRRTITNLERGVTTAPYRETVALLAGALRLTESDRAELECAVQRARTPVRAERRAAAPGWHPATSADPLLSTKLAIPPSRSTVIPRPQLMQRLRAGLQRPLTLLSAPAGSGKTTLLSAWRTTPEGRAGRLAWVSLDAADNDLTRFWRYVLAAIDHAAPGVGLAVLGVLQSSDPPAVEAVVTALVNRLAPLGGDIVLVLDDYHLIEAESIHRMLGLLIEHRPPCLHILVATRADPPLPLARLRARGEFTELRADDLRFSQEEAGEFFHRVMGLSLSPAEVAALEARTEGWIAGLQLAGLSLQGRPAEDTAAFIADFTGSHRYIVDYLLDEVLLRQAKDVQRFLSHTCILDRLCASLCAAVLDGENPAVDYIAESQEMLEALERKNVFLTALDDERRWYRYHHLFADALRQRRGGDAPIPDVSVLHRRASSWFERQNLIGEAISHALAGGNYDSAADLIPRAMRPIVSRGKPQGLTAWYGALPEATLQSRPDLAIGYAWILLDLRDVLASEKYIRHAEAALSTGPDTHGASSEAVLQGYSEALRAIIAVMQGDPDRAIAQASVLLDSPADDEGTARSVDRPSTAELRSVAAIALGLAHLSRGAAKQAADAFSRVPVKDLPATAAHNVAIAAAGKASAYRLAGDLDRARAAYQEAIQWDEDHAHAQLLLGSLYTGLADVLRERNDVDAALKHVTLGLGLEPALGVSGSERWVEWNVCSRLVLARIKHARGDPEGALADVHEAQAQLEGTSATTFAAILAAFEAQLRLLRGDLDSAVRWLRSGEARQAPPRFGMTPQAFVYTAEHLDVAPIQVLIAQGRASRNPAPIHRALALLDQLQQKAEQSHVVWLRAKTLVLQALARHALGEMAGALSVLEEALVLAEPGRYMRLFLDEGPAVAKLLRGLRAHSVTSDYVSAVLDAVADHPQGHVQEAPQLRGAEPGGQRLADPLTHRELDVLRLLEVGQSTAEIARTLYVEVTTVRTHVKHLYNKLGAHSRDQALWRARELNLL